MSLLGFDAIGSLAIGQFSRSLVLTAAPGSFALSGQAATFTITEAPAVGSFALTGISASFSVGWPDAGTAFAFTGIATTFKVSEAGSVGSFTLNGQPANELILWPDPAGTFTLSSPVINLARTGFDYEFQQGGIGHYLEEMERARQLAKITRKTPQPIDRRTVPRFEPLRAAPVAPIAMPVDQSALQNQRMAEAAIAAQAAAKRRRREEEALLLLAC